MITKSVPLVHEPRSRYRSVWRVFPQDLGYLLLSGVLITVIGLAYGAVGSVAVWSGDGLASLIVLAAGLLGALYVSKFFGLFELRRLGWAGAAPSRPVTWRRRTASNRFVWALEVAADPHYWLYFLYTFVVFPLVGGLIVGAIGALMVGVIAAVLGGIGFFLLTFLAGSTFGPPLDGAIGWSQVAAGILIGIAVLVVLPYVTRGGVRAMSLVATGLLGGFLSEQLEAEVVGLQQSRSAAVSAEGTALRRLERDIHDGPQQRLIRIQMDLAAAARAVDDAPEKSQELIDSALRQARDALEELRALSRGFAPPLLLDRGLAPALEAVVDRATVPTRFTNELPDGLKLPVEIERNAYFIAAELLANVDKHAGAHRAEVVLSVSETNSHHDVLIIVTDDGAGGAAPQIGHGLAGIEERLTGLGGRMVLRSPAGGPTHVMVTIPVAISEGEPSVEPQPEAP